MADPIILALDIATLTGWALGPVVAPITQLEAAAGVVPRKPESGVVEFAGKDGKSFERFENWVQGNLQVYRPEFLFFEAPILPSRTQIRVLRKLYGMAAVVELVARRYPATQVFEVDVATIKKHATGSGRAKKSAMIAAARRMGWHPSDDNEADAIWLWDYGCSLVRAAQREAA